MTGNEIFEQKVRRALGITDDTIPVVITSETERYDTYCDTCEWSQVVFDVSVGTAYTRIGGLGRFLDWLDAEESEVPDQIAFPD